MTIKYPSTAAQEDTLNEIKGTDFDDTLDKLAKISDIIDGLATTLSDLTIVDIDGYES